MMKIPDAPWVGCTQEDYEERLSRFSAKYRMYFEDENDDLDENLDENTDDKVED